MTMHFLRPTNRQQIAERADAILLEAEAMRDLAAALGRFEEATGRRPELSTSGGTSDARFVKDHCPVVEFGLVGQTMHMVDERVSVADLETLTQIYETFIDRWFSNAAA